jgi:hypothetical protein
MQLHTHFSYDFPFEVYTPVVNGTVTTWVKRTESSGMFNGSAAGGGAYLTAKDQVGVGDAVRNLRDRTGNQIFIVNGQPYDMYVNEATPVLDAYGELVAWRHTLRRKLPTDFTDKLLEIADRVAPG